MIKRILVGLGGTPFTTVAVKRAVELAQIHQARLTGVTVVELDRLKKVGPVPPGAGTYAKRLSEKRIAITKERQQEAVAAFEQACLEADVPYHIESEKGNPFDLMISHSRYHDLTIFGLKSLFDYGITSEPKDTLIRLVSQGVRPIMAVSPEFRTIRKALVGYSGSMESAKAMRRFIQMRLWPECRIKIVHFSKDVSKGKELIKEAASYCRSHGFETDTLLAHSHSDKDLLSQAQKSNADIIVMGNSIRHLLLRQILGSMVLTTIQNADRPLFLAQ
jgi:nucleotide-binding universal stress UspA family protein